ncbi:MAG TPA: HD domain-containing protein [Thermoplasmata archaeon]|nr:HD domain-containing protein [Thermoplasmata archaeon]
MAELKSINDTVHGTLRLDPLVLDLLESLELQRLNGIRQLGLTYLVFPGANHSRVEHCLGVAHVAGEIAEAVGLPEEERRLLVAAGLLHDLGHGPFSHTLEHVLAKRLGVDHMDVTMGIIEGKRDTVPGRDRKALPEIARVPAVLEEHGLRPRAVAALIKGRSAGARGLSVHKGQAHFAARRCLAQIIHSAVDADQIDYLMRDSHYTGVALGMIDFRRLLQTFAVHNGELVLQRKGVPALEGMLTARALMYSSVYFHKTVRIAEQMLSRAVERSEGDITAIQSMVDAELVQWLLGQGGFQREVALRLKYRKLFKRVWVRGKYELDDGERAALARLSDSERRREAEDAIARRAGAKPGGVLVDIPLPELLISEPRIAKTDVKVLDRGRLAPLHRVSPLARALQLRDVSDWVVMAAARPEERKAVERQVERVLFA